MAENSRKAYDKYMKSLGGEELKEWEAMDKRKFWRDYERFLADLAETIGPDGEPHGHKEASRDRNA